VQPLKTATESARTARGVKGEPALELKFFSAARGNAENFAFCGFRLLNLLQISIKVRTFDAARELNRSG